LAEPPAFFIGRGFAFASISTATKGLPILEAAKDRTTVAP